MTTMLEDLAVTRVTLCGKGINEDAEILLFKAQDMNHEYEDRGDGMCATCGMTEAEHKMAKADEPPVKKEAAPVAETITKADLEAVETQRDALQAELDALKDMSPETVAELMGLELAKAEPTEDDVLKALPDEVRERIEKAETAVAKMQAENRKAEFVRKARDDFGDLAPAEEFGPVLEEIDRLAPDAAKTLDTMLKAVAARAETSHLFKELGKSEGESDPVAKVNARAAEIKKADPELSDADALQRAMHENTEAAREAFDRK